MFASCSDRSTHHITHRVPLKPKLLREVKKYILNLFGWHWYLAVSSPSWIVFGGTKAWIGKRRGAGKAAMWVNRGVVSIIFIRLWEVLLTVWELLIQIFTNHCSGHNIPGFLPDEQYLNSYYCSNRLALRRHHILCEEMEMEDLVAKAEAKRVRFLDPKSWDIRERP